MIIFCLSSGDIFLSLSISSLFVSEIFCDDDADDDDDDDDDEFFLWYGWLTKGI